MRLKRYNPNTDGDGGGTNNLDDLGFSASDLGIKTPAAGGTGADDDATKKATADKLIADKAAADKAAADKLEAEKAAAAAAGTGGSNNPPAAVEIDGKEYKLDKDGNALLEDGSVFKSKNDLEALEAASDDEPFIASYQKQVGIAPLNEDGKPKVYEDSEEGFIQYNKDVAALQAKKGFEELLNSDPDFKKFYEYRQRGGKTSDFFKQASNSWKAVKLDTKNEGMLKDAVVASLVRTGMSKETAELTANMYKDTNKLEQIGKESYDSLVAAEDAREQQEKANYEASIKQEEEDTKKHWGEVRETIKKGTLANITVPDSDRDAFFKYVAVAADKNGNSQSALDNDTLTVEQWLQLEYIKFKKLDLSKLITAAAKTERVKSIKSRFTKGESGLGDGQGVNKDDFKSKNNLDGIDLDSVVSGKSTKQ